MPVFERNSLSINYQIFGSGPRVLFFNGSGGSIEGSQLLINAFAKTCQVLVHDQRGLGKTSVPKGPYTMADYANDAAALLDHVGWQTSNIIGLSFGGMVAQEFAVTFPDRIQRLVLMCTSAGGIAGSSYPLHQLAQLPTDERNKALRMLTDTRFTDEWLASHPLDAEIMRFQEDRPNSEKTALQIEGERLQLEARMGHDVADRLLLISAPTLITAGRFDGIAPLVNSQAIAERIPNSTLNVYEGGHPFLSQDRQAMRDIRAFLQQAEPIN
ncbi:MAG: alpha/beta hydrolase [Actinomycetota bacterium]